MCPNCPDPKVRFFFVNVKLNVLTHFFPDRTYAITRKNKLVAGILYTISATQFGIGVAMFVRAAMKPGQYFRSTAFTLEPRN